ncbi:glycosyltransferase family 2 protein [Pseudocitrobacter sp. 73]|uniref:glycosyltransferase family 2 protein n=1 Tax=Pseudocitrobacter sp. 73 TaxID=2605731 RepID=UPI0011EBBFE9|nr:glycosyltransferase family 2 protein [Pseudocitrobacter sp. 73]KAA1050725.1 glycosyltransferase family 2 protein [Pseudocitrobacter sp. 73]
MTMKFSIIIPLYNKEKYIASAIWSILDQTYQDFEIIVVDDGSTDKSVCVVENINDTRIKVIKQKNCGVSCARNTGINNAVGDYLLFLDGDDIYLPNALEHFSFLIEKFPDNGYYCSNYYRVRDGHKTPAIDVSRILGKKFEYGVVDNFFYIAAYHPGSFPCHASTFCIERKSLLISELTFPNGVTHTEDVYFCSLLAMKFRPVFSRECIHEYNLNTEANSRNTRPTNERFIIEELRKYVDTIPWLKHFLAKNIIHLLYNCLEFGDQVNFYKHKKEPMFSYSYMLSSYKIHFLVLKFLPFKLLRKLYLIKLGRKN